MGTIKKRYDFTNAVLFSWGLAENIDVAQGIAEALCGMRFDKFYKVEAEATESEGPLEKSMRLDVRAEAHGKVFDIEMQTYRDLDLNYRMRFAEQRLVRRRLKAGCEYAKLPDSIVIFICTYDHYGLGLPIYTIEHRCLEAAEANVSDGTRRIVANTTAWERCPEGAEATRSLLRYLKTGMVGEDALTRRMEEIVEEANSDGEMVSAMASYEEHMRWAEEAMRKIGYEKGFSEGKAEGKAEGVVQGRALERATRDSLFGRVITTLFASGRQDDVAKLGDDPSLVERYAKELGIKS